MNRYRDTIYLTKGEADVTHIFTVMDGNGNSPDLSDPGWSAKLYAGNKDAPNVIDGAAMTILPDQVNYRGGMSYMFTAAFIAAVEIDTYEMSVIVQHTDGRKIEYPKYENDQFGSLIIQRSKAG